GGCGSARLKLRRDRQGQQMTQEIRRARCPADLFYTRRDVDDGCELNWFPQHSILNAQSQLNHHARTEDVDLRDGGEFGVVAENLAALPLRSLLGAQSKSQRGRDGGAAFRYSNQVDLRSNHRSSAGRNSLSAFESLH